MEANVHATAKIISETSASKLFDLNQHEMIETMQRIIQYYLDISGIHAVEIIDDLSHETFAAVWVENGTIQNSQFKTKPDFIKNKHIKVIMEPVNWQEEQIGSTKVYYSDEVLLDRSRTLKETVFERIGSYNEQLFDELETLIYYGAAGIIFLVLVLIVTIVFAFQKLEQRINETQDMLAEAKKMASMGSLVAGVAHEINTPIGIGITSISQISDITQDLIQKMAEGKIKKTHMQSALENISQLADLSFSGMQRTSSLVEEFKKAAVNDDGEETTNIYISDTLQNAFSFSRQEIPQSSSQLSLSCPEELIILNYKQPFYEAIKGLISNSLIHGFGEQEGTVSITVTDESKQIVIDYWDDGCGIPEEMRPRIFEPFSTSKRIEGRKGLGMHIVYNIFTHKMGGSIECIPSDSGARFRIILPTNINVGIN